MAPAGRLEHAVVKLLASSGRSLATAESFTGGQLAAAITSVPGASRVFSIGWVTYAAAQKTAQLGVDAAIIDSQGLVSDQVAAAMAEGALRRSGGDLALSTTGSAGPDPLEQPGHAPVPVGRIYVGLARVGFQTQVRGYDFAPPRSHIQERGVHAALALALESLTS